MLPAPEDLALMRTALAEAVAAWHAGEVPVGAVVVRHGRILARGRNASCARHDPTAHAEIVALRAAGRIVGNYRLPGADLYVSLEPCCMCVGALVQARIRRVVFAASDPKAGALGGAFDLRATGRFNHAFSVAGGVCAAEARDLLQRFFEARRRADS